MKKKLLILPLTATLLLAGCATNTDGSSVTSGADASSEVTTSMTSEEAKTVAKAKYAEKSQKAEAKANEIVKSNKFGLKTVFDVDFMEKENDVEDVNVDMTLTSIANVDNATLAKVYTLNEELDALTESTTTTQEQYNAKMSEYAKAIAADTSMYYVNLTGTEKIKKDTDAVNANTSVYVVPVDGKAYTSCVVGEKDLGKVYYSFADYAGVYYSLLSGFVNALNQEDATIEDAVSSTVSSVMEMVEPLISAISTQTKYGSIIALAENVLSEGVPEIVSFLDGKTTATDLQKFLKENYGLMINFPEKTNFYDFVKAIYTAIKNLNYDSMYDVTYANDTFTFALNLANIKSEISSLSAKIQLAYATYIAPVKETDTVAVTYANYVVTYASMAIAALTAWTPTTFVVSEAITFTNDLISEVKTTIDITAPMVNISNGTVTTSSSEVSVDVLTVKGNFDAKIQLQDSFIDMPTFDKTTYTEGSLTQGSVAPTTDK